MKFDTFKEVLDTRSGKCIVCSKIFPDSTLRIEHVTYPVVLNKKSVSLKLTGKGPDFYTCSTLNFSVVNNSIRIGQINNNKKLIQLRFTCANARHRHDIGISAFLDVDKNITSEVELVDEAVMFGSKKHFYKVVLDWRNNTTKIYNPSGYHHNPRLAGKWSLGKWSLGPSNGLIEKPSILRFGSKQELISTIDMFYNLL